VIVRLRTDSAERLLSPFSPVNYLIYLAMCGSLFAAFYVLLTGKSTGGHWGATVLGLIAAMPLLDGGFLLAREFAMSDRARVSAGVVFEKFSSTGEAGTKTVGGGRFSRMKRLQVPWLHTAEGFRYHDVVARLVLTGTRAAWVVQYRYQCATPYGCFRNELVSRELWGRLAPGQPVNIRTVKGEDQSGRLDENPMWSTAYAHLGFGGTLAFAALLVSRRGKVRRRRYVTVPAVVTAVETLTAGEDVRWRVRFAYFAADGTARESADEIYVPGLKVGDDCSATYPELDPDLGALEIGPGAATTA
jgi:hypothetical protein